MNVMHEQESLAIYRYKYCHWYPSNQTGGERHFAIGCHFDSQYSTFRDSVLAIGAQVNSGQYKHSSKKLTRLPTPLTRQA